MDLVELITELPDRQLPPAGSRLYLYSGDVQLEQVQSDGSTIQLFSDVTPPNATFPTGTQESIPVGQTLQPGDYRIVLVGGSMVSEYLSLVYYPGLWDWDLDQTLANFTIAPKSPSDIEQRHRPGNDRDPGAEHCRFARSCQLGERRPVRDHAGPRALLAIGCATGSPANRQPLTRCPVAIR